MAHVNGNAGPTVSTASPAYGHVKQALRCFRRKEFGKSCAYFCIAFTLNRGANLNLFEKYKGTFLYCLSSYTALLEEKKDFDGVVDAFEQTLVSCPDSEDVYFLFACFHCRRLKYCDATFNLLQAIKINPNYHLAYVLLENIKSSSIKRWHFSMMNDVVRNNAFKSAIERAVAKGHDLVLDIGAGCGLLSYFAAKADAQEIHACEVNELIFHICKDIFNVNDLEDRIKLINKMSTDIVIGEDIPRKATLVATEIFDSAVFGENCLPTLVHAWKELIDVQKGIVVPNKVTVYGALIQSETLRQQFRLTWKEYGNFKLPMDAFVSDNTMELRYTTEDLNRIFDLQYLSDPFVITTVDLNEPQSLEEMLKPEFEIRLPARVNRDGHLCALGVWFTLTLIDEITISTSPESPSTAWEQAVYNMTTDRRVKEGETVNLRVSFHKSAMEIKEADTELPERSILVSDDLMRYLNSNKYMQFVLERCSSLFSELEAVKILYFSCFPLLGLHAATLPNVRSIDAVNDSEEVNVTLNSFLRYLSTTDSSKFKLIQYDDILTKQNCEWNFLLMDFVEGNGLLRSNLLERIFYLKVTLFKNKTIKIFPAKITIVGMIIQSNDLLRRSRLLSNENVAGLKVCEFINILETETIQEINVTKFDYAALSNHFELLTINLNDEVEPDDSVTEPSHAAKTIVTGTGEVHAVVFWYLLHADGLSQDPRLVFNSRTEPNWNQAAFVVKNPFFVRKGESLELTTTFCQGFLRIRLKKQ